jgi:hypothetical protein
MFANVRLPIPIFLEQKIYMEPNHHMLHLQTQSNEVLGSKNHADEA